jgi:hypothetical protein
MAGKNGKHRRDESGEQNGGMFGQAAPPQPCTGGRKPAGERPQPIARRLPSEPASDHRASFGGSRARPQRGGRTPYSKFKTGEREACSRLRAAMFADRALLRIFREMP